MNLVTETLIISSSPAKPFTTYHMSSSPSLPSPGEKFTKKVPALRAGSRAAPIPQHASSSFTSATSLLKAGSPQVMGATASHEEKIPAKPRSRKPALDRGDGAEDGAAKKKDRKPAVKKDDAQDDGAAEQKPRKPRTKKVDELNGKGAKAKEKAPRKPRAKKVGPDDDTVKEKAPRKPRAKKSDGNAQTKLPKQITKSLAAGGQDLPAQNKKSETTEDDPIVDSLDYGLAEAVKRRTNWTPPPPSFPVSSIATPVAADSLGTVVEGLGPSEEKGKGFRNLLGSFGFSKVGEISTVRTAPTAGATRKRKRIELVKTSDSSTTAVPKVKAPRKKPRTITEQATSAYAEESEEPPQPASLLKHFALETADRLVSEGFKVPPKPRSRSPAKAGKGTAQAPILLSPESALKQAGNQDFVFGTSSQLAREESPGFLRDVHAAMQASNEIDNEDPFASSPIQFETKSKTLSSMKRTLWSAAARDGDGQLLDIEMAELVDPPTTTKQPQELRLPEADSKETCKPTHQSGDSAEKLSRAATNTIDVTDLPKQLSLFQAATDPDALNTSISSNSVVSPVKSTLPANSVLPKPASKAKGSRTSQSKQPEDLEKPDFSAYTMAKLVKQIAAYHFKPIKSREQMITILEKCWDSKNRAALGTLATNLPVSSPKKAAHSVTSVAYPSQVKGESPKRPRGRPRKNSNATPSPKRKTKTASVANALARAKKAQKKAEALEEISDSDTTKTPSPPRRRPSQAGTPPLPLQLSSSASIDSCELSPTSSQTQLFQYITSAVRGSPPAKDSLNPSWHEKILLYDPIILEDLTVWLNTGALEKVGWDGEVDPKEVKKWCESKSICCLWKENLRGGSRSRY